MAWSRSRGEKPSWYVLLQQLGDDSDTDDSTYSPAASVDSAPDDDPDDEGSIDLTYTDDESESDDSVHTSDEEFIDDD
eukprot:COSAG01_NODE_45598_length_408_cov_0.511327_2_plen_77_part_01